MIWKPAGSFIRKPRFGRGNKPLDWTSEYGSASTGEKSNAIRPGCPGSIFGTGNKARLVSVANRWNESMGIDVRYPDAHADFITRCHDSGQTRPTPLLLQYGEGDFNALHQDVYGEQVFPLQVAILLSEPQKDFTGGEFVLTEQRPRMQSRVEVVPFERGDGVIWAVRNRPAQGTRGIYRVNMRHGVSRLRSGHRHTLGIIFHDAT